MRSNWAKAPRVPPALPWVRQISDGVSRNAGKSKWHLLAERRHGSRRFSRTPSLIVLTRCGEMLTAVDQANEAINFNGLPIPPGAPTQVCGTCSGIGDLLLHSQVV